MIEPLTVSGAILLAAIAQSLTGFGFALVAMSLLPSMIGLKQAAPLIALISVLSNGFLWFYYRHAFDYKVVFRLTISALVAIPFGLTLLNYLSEAIALRGLGILIVSYVIYDFCDLALPQLKAVGWTYFFGFLAGLLTGAYNTGGPPLVVYGNCSRRKPEAYKSNLPSFFLINSLVVLAGHAVQKNLTTNVWHLTLWAIPAFAVGLTLGTLWSKRMNPSIFKRVVLILLLFTGLQLII